MLRILRKLGRGDGAEIAEVAMVLPVVFTFLLGIIWFGRAFQIYSTITQAAQQGAVTAARPLCASCGTGSGWNSTSFPDDTSVESAIFSVMDASSLNRSQIIVYIPVLPACPAPPAPPGGGCTTTANNVSICRAVQLNGLSTPPQCGTVVSFQYPFQFNLPFTSLNMQQIVLKAQAQSRMEN